MNYREFVDCVGNGIRGFLPEEMKSVLIEPTEVEKLQDESYYGLRVISDTSNIGVCLNLKNMYMRMLTGESFDSVVCELRDTVVNALNSRQEFDAYDFKNYEAMKKHLMLQIVGTEANKELLAAIPHREIEDMSLVYRFVLDSDTDREASILINNDLISEYGISEEQIYLDTVENSAVNFPVSFRFIGDVLEDLIGCEEGFFDTSEVPLFVVTCNNGINGAAAVFYPGVMKDIAARIRADFYILPSSTHEVLVLPDMGDIDTSNLISMVTQINDHELSSSDRLSYNVYHYEASTDTFETVEKYQTRKA